MHQHHRHARRGDHFGRARIVGQRRHVVDQPRAGPERRRHHVRLARVDRHRRAAAGELADDRHDALDLVAFPHRLRAGPGRFAADIDDRRAFARPCRAPASAAAAASAKLPAVGEAVGRRVEDAHHLRLVEPDGALAQLQRRPRRGQRLPLRGHVVVEAASRCPRPATSSAATRLLPSTLSSSTARTSSARRRAARPCRHGRTANRRSAVGRRSVRIAF